MRRVEPVETHDSGREPWWPQLRDLQAALGMLTALPFDRHDIRSGAAAPATLFFPVVGGLIGLLLVGSNRLIAAHLPPFVSAIILVAIWEAVAAGSGEAAPGYRLFLAVVLLAKVALLAAHITSRPAALLFAPLLARWAMVVLAVGARDAAAPARKLNAAITFREFALTSVFTCAVVFTVAEAFGILLVVGVAALTLGLRLWQHQRLGGTAWRRLLASAELVELLVLAIASVVAGR